MNKNILFVQHGDFSAAYDSFKGGGLETYRDQRASVDFVAGLASFARVTTFAFGCDRPFTELEPNLFAMCGHRSSFNGQQISSLFDKAEAGYLVLRTPHVGFLREAAERRMAVLPIFADIFTSDGIRGSFRNWRLRRALEKSQAPCFSNHSLNASQSMVDALGLPKEKIVPWDWTRVPLSGDAKSRICNPNRPTAFFAGTLSEAKGVGDCLNAISLLREAGIILEMSFAGPGETAQWVELAESLGIVEQVKFLGIIPNVEVRNQMHKHDFVIVASRHNYPEGLPNTIYEGLASRSALVISDHPAFAGRLKSNSECLVFTAGDPESLSSSIKRGVLDSELYQRLSLNSSDAHANLYIGLEWTALVKKFIDDPANLSGWVEMNSLDLLERK